MKRSGIVFFALITMLLAGTSSAGPPISGDYQSTDLGGPVYLGRYSEAWNVGGSALDPGTTLNAESFDGADLGTQWRYWCSTVMAPPVLLVDNVDGNGNGNRTYMKTFIGGYIWLSGSGPWANGDPSYPGTIDTYAEFETITYSNWQPITAVTNVQATAHFDAYPDQCMAFYIGNGSEVGSTDKGDTKPADFPDFLDIDCNPTRTNGAWWDFFTITLSIAGCTTPTEETSWGAVKALYSE
jgi:hypothetical protein